MRFVPRVACRYANTPATIDTAGLYSFRGRPNTEPMGFCSDRSEITPDFSTHDRFSPSLRSRAPQLLWPLLTSGNPSRHLAMPIAQGRLPDLPGYYAPTFTLMRVGSTSPRSVHVSGLVFYGLLTPRCRLYPLPVRRASALLPASFRPPVTRETVAFR